MKNIEAKEAKESALEDGRFNALKITSFLVFKEIRETKVETKNGLLLMIRCTAHSISCVFVFKEAKDNKIQMTPTFREFLRIIRTVKLVICASLQSCCQEQRMSVEKGSLTAFQPSYGAHISESLSISIFQPAFVILQDEKKQFLKQLKLLPHYACY